MAGIGIRRKRPTLVPLLLNLKLLCEIFILFPPDLGANGAIVDEITRISDLFLVEISLLEDVVLEEVIGAEDEEDLEAWLACLVIEVRELNINKVLEGFHIAICDQLGEGDMISECGEPEVRNTIRGGSGVFRQGGILFILLDRVLLATIELLPCGLSGSSDDRMSAIIQRFLEAKVLRERVGKRYGSKGNRSLLSSRARDTRAYTGSAARFA